ncbi:unnamed protein product [Caenorhabditis sp. 36 PRJEB53466]|nr:unnamed protein product [Caenorhabditis sp. 36 PRJEB53466]
MGSKAFTVFITLSQYVGTYIATPLNVFLIYMIWTKSPKKIGNYRYLMIYVSLFELFFAFLAYITGALIYSCTTRVIVIVKSSESVFSRNVWILLDCLMCAVYLSSMTVFSIHFLYRYSYLYPSGRKLFEGWRIAFWMLLPIAVSVASSTLYYNVFAPTAEFTEFIRKALSDDLDINVDDFVYVGPYYFPEDKNGIHDMDWNAFCAMTAVWVLVGLSAITLFVCGYGCYSKISSGLEVSRNSQQTKAIQQQLFYALVMQSAIPCLLMYIPTTIVHFCTFIRQNIGSASSFISYSVALYPAVDPFPTLIIVKNYRRATKEMLARCFNFGWCTRKKEAQENIIRMQTVGSPIVSPPCR